MSAARRPATAIVGTGRLARVLAPSLHAAGYPLVAVIGRRLADARRVCRGLHDTAAGTDPARAAEGAELLLLAVPDRAIRDVAEDLVRAGGDWRGRVVLHHAGMLGPEPLRPLARRGAEVGLLHPLQCLGDSRAARRWLAGSRARIEGAPRAAAVARRLARDLGLVPLKLAPELSAGDRAAYHAAASLVSNDVVALLGLAVRLLESLGVARAPALEALTPLARGTLAQAGVAGLAGALSGPVVRGDERSVASQLAALGRRSRDGADAHRALGRLLLRLAEDEGRAPPRDARRRLRRLLRSAGPARAAGV